MGLIVATKAFCKLLFDKNLSNAFNEWAQSGGASTTTPKIETKPAQKPAAKPAKPIRSDAISLLAALQREARLIDIVKEPLANFSDEQVGAAARDVLTNTGKVLDRIFDLQPLTDQEDGSSIETPADFDTGRYNLTGNVSGEAPYRGKLAHHGWEAKQCQLPNWTGSKSSAKVIAPIEIEL
jgi:hypothetical protein